MKFQTILLAAIATVFPSAYAASIKYEFTGGSLAATTSGLPAGVTASNFSLGAYTLASLDVVANNALRITDADTTTNSTATAISPNNQVLSFSLTIPANVTLNLTSFTHDLTSSGLSGTQAIYARLFSSIDGYDSAANDTISVVGRYANGPNSGTLTANLANPTGNPFIGSNVTAGDFNGLTSQTITFYMPLVEIGPPASSYTQLDNITLNFDVVPEPSATLLGGLSLLTLLRRRR